MRKIIRMDKPMDTLVKRQTAYAGEITHEFHELPGKYIGACANEYPDSQISVPRVDSAYKVKIKGKIYIINREDESGPIDANVFEKINKYRILLEYASNMPVIPVITTHLPVNKSLITVGISLTTYMDVIVISYPTLDGSERLSTIRKKINDEEVLSGVEAMNLVMLPRMFTSGNAEILEEVCVLLKKAKVESIEVKHELIFEMDCVIHKYAETLDDIRRLEEVIDLSAASNDVLRQEQRLIDKGIKQGIEQGIEQGAFDLALKIKRDLGLEKAIELSGFSRQELESEKLNR